MLKLNALGLSKDWLTNYNFQNPVDLTTAFAACHDGRVFARQFETMHEVWENCRASEWQMWMVCRIERFFESDIKQGIVSLIDAVYEIGDCEDTVNGDALKDIKSDLVLEIGSAYQLKSVMGSVLQHGKNAPMTSAEICDLIRKHIPNPFEPPSK